MFNIITILPLEYPRNLFGETLDTSLKNLSRLLEIEKSKFPQTLTTKNNQTRNLTKKMAKEIMTLGETAPK